MKLLERLALHRPELRAWALYDWANSAYFTTIVTAVFPTYYSAVAAEGLDPDLATERFAFTTSIALALAALMGPVLGSFADRAPLKKRFLAFFMALGAISSVLLYFVGEGDWILALVLFGIGNVAISSSLVFYDSLLPHVADENEIDRVSVAGYAIGYLGGGLLLTVNLAWVLKPALFGLPDAGAASRASFISVGVWWIVFSIPLLRRVTEPEVRVVSTREQPNLWRESFTGLARTIRELMKYPQAAKLMLAFLLYNDGISTIIRMSVVYGTSLGLEQSSLIAAVLVVQFIGIPFTFLFGQLAGRIGTKRSIFVSLAVYMAVSVLAWQMTTATEFFVLAALVGMVQGGAQALSRSLFASMIPVAKSAEFFGLFGVLGKFASIFGPSLFAIAVAVSGSQRTAILSVIVFFVAGGALLLGVDVEAGQAQRSFVDDDG